MSELTGGTLRRKTIVEEAEFEWELADFFTIIEIEKDSVCKSPVFSFASGFWYLELFPKDNNDPTFLALYLCNDKKRERSVEYSFGIKKQDGAEEQLIRKVMPGAEKFTDHWKFIRRSEIYRRKEELVPSRNFTITCRLKTLSSVKPDYENFMNDECRSLDEAYKRMFLDGRHHDLILKVEKEEFPVHRDILKIRAPVFDSMLRIKMKEESSRKVDVPNWDSIVMKQFLLYVYSGKIETLDESNMIKLYCAAEKYEMAGLKEKCRNILKDSLSPINVTKVIQHAWNYSDSDLEAYIMHYFSNNIRDILRTVEWQNFLRNNFIEASEILIKSVDNLTYQDDFYANH